MSTTAPSCSPGRASCPRENRRGPPSSISKEQVAPSEPALEQAKPRISLRQPPANDRGGAASRRRHPVAVVDARDPSGGEPRHRTSVAADPERATGRYL